MKTPQDRMILLFLAIIAALSLFCVVTTIRNSPSADGAGKEIPGKDDGAKPVVSSPYPIEGTSK